MHFVLLLSYYVLCEAVKNIDLDIDLDFDPDLDFKFSPYAPKPNFHIS